MLSRPRAQTFAVLCMWLYEVHNDLRHNRDGASLNIQASLEAFFPSMHMVEREDLGRDGFLPLTRPFQFLLRSLKAASVPYRLCPTSSWSAVMGSTEPQGLLHRGKSRVGDGDAGGVAPSAS